jgi:hypothetical protein
LNQIHVEKKLGLAVLEALNKKSRFRKLQKIKRKK